LYENFVLHFTESLIEKALSLDVLQLLSDYLKKYNQEEDLLHMVLLSVGSLADTGMCMWLNWCQLV
jgi:hypothetical protein